MAQMCVTCTTGRVHVNVNNLACQGIKDNLITIANLLALDSFLYEEETYNYWGHTENELIKERSTAVVLELFIAGWIAYSTLKMYGGLGPNAKQSSSVMSRGMV